MTNIEKPGLRIFKTAIAVFLSLVICHLRSEEAMPFYGAIAAIICMKVDLNETIDVGKNRIIGTFLGGFTGLIYLVTFRKMGLSDFLNYFLISVVVFILIWIMANLNMPNAISIMCIVFISITINHGEAPDYPVAFALNRTIDTLVGVIIAIIVNWSDFELRKKIKHRD